MKRFLASAALAVVAVFVVSSQAAPKPKVIEAEQFIVRDAEGKKRLVLGIEKPVAKSEGPVPCLLIYDEDSKLRLAMQANKEFAGLTFEEEGTTRLGLVAAKNKLAGLIIYRRPDDPKSRIALTYADDGKPMMFFNDTNGKTRTMLMLQPDGKPFFALQNEEGKAFFFQHQQ